MRKLTKYMVCLIIFACLSGKTVAQDYIYEATTSSQRYRIELRNTVTNEIVEGLQWSPRDIDNWDYSLAGDKYALDVSGWDLIPQDTLKSRLRLNKATSATYVAPTILSQTTGTCSKAITINSCPAGQQAVWYHFDEFSYHGPRYPGRLYNSPPEVLQKGGTSFTLESNKHRDLSRYFVSCENTTGTERSLLTGFSYSVLREWDFDSGRTFINSCSVKEHTLSTRSSGSSSTLITQVSLFREMQPLLPTNIVTPTETTMYYGRSYDSATGCFGVLDSVLINVYDVTAPSITPSTSICAGSNIELTGSCERGNLKWYKNGDFNTELTSTTVSPIVTTYYYGVCSLGTCTNSKSTTITVTPGLSLTAASFGKTNTQNIYKTDGRISINGLVANTAYRVSYSFNGMSQSPVSYTTNASGMLNITGFTPGSYSSFNVSNPSGCSSGVVSSTQVID